MPLKFLCSIFALLAFSLFSETPQDGKALLSSHETLAKFQGVQKRKCLGRTSLCPDRCGHSGAVAHFKIIKYLSYNKLGKYGDAKGSSFQTLLTKIQDPKILSRVKSLKKGDQVLLNWEHQYITKNGSSWPVRVITKLTKK